MFNNIRDKFYSVVKDGVGTKIFTKPEYSDSNADVNCNAGAKILEKYQKEWEEMHCLSEQNAHAADSLATEINNMHFKLQKDYNNFIEINHLLNGTPLILQNIHNCVELLTGLKKLFQNVELSLINLEDIIEIGELQEKQLEHRFQLALYKEKKLANLELKRVDLAAKHAQSLKQFEIVQQQKLHERQEIFNEAFQNDLKVYKEDGTVPKIESTSKDNSPTLEEIQLDINSDELDEFLNK